MCLYLLEWILPHALFPLLTQVCRRRVIVVRCVCVWTMNVNIGDMTFLY